MERRLAAILIADVVGYGRHSQADEEGTRARFQADLREVFEPAIASSRGRLVKTMGDGLLVEFQSVVDALRCAVSVQGAKAERDANAPPEASLAFRIGINLGDVIVEGEDIHGDGVNIADRLQALAEAGGIAVSGTAYDHLNGKLPIGFAALGAQRMKNIAEPIRVYRVLLDPAAGGKTLRSPRAGNRRWLWPAAAILLLLGLAGGAAWWWAWRDPIEPASPERMALPLPAKPSIAVLPFSNLSDDPRQDYFADGITDDLITDLSKISGLFVISRNSSFVYKGRSVPVAQVAEELGVRYVLEGSVQRAGDRLRINAQLIDALSGGHEWAERFDGALADVFALQDRVTSSIADALEVRLTPAELSTLGRQETKVPAAYDAFLRAWEHLRRRTPEDLAAAEPFLLEAVALDPDYGRAYAGLAFVYATPFKLAPSARMTVSDPEGRRSASRYLTEAQKRPTALSHQVTGLLLWNARKLDLALAELREAIALDPADPLNYAYISLALSSAGQPAEALEYIRTAMRLDPRYPPWFDLYLGLAQFGLEQYGEAAATLGAALDGSPDDESVLVLLASTYGHLGRGEEALSILARVDAVRVARGGTPAALDMVPNIMVPDFGYRRLADLDRFKEGLRLAGMRESLFSGAFAEQNLLTAQEARNLFFGHSLHGSTPDLGEQHSASITADGVADLSGDWGEFVGRRIAFAGDDLCYHEAASGVGYCGRVYRNPGGTRARENEFIWHDDRRTVTFSPVD